MVKIIQDKIFDCLRIEEICESYFQNNSDNRNDSVLIISNCIISKLDFSTYTTKVKVIVENCIIKNLDVHCAWFGAGLSFRNNVVENDVDYQMGGHNKAPVEIVDNIFLGHWSFFDCQFESQLIIKGNIFKCGSDLLYKENKGFDNYFKSGYVLENNIGNFEILNQ